MTHNYKDYIPSGWRIGQTISNFLDWLNITKGITDIFYIEDTKFASMYKEYVEMLKGTPEPKL